MPDPAGAECSQTILLVEDDPAVRSVATRALSRWGYAVLATASGTEALRVAREYEGQIDLMITDVMMPGMNGVAVAEAVGRLRPGVRVVFMSGYADRGLHNKGLLEPDTHFLQKPFTPQELAGRVREILDGSAEA